MEKKIIIPIMILAVVILVVWIVLSKSTDINTVPTYGGIEKNDQQKQADEKFVRQSIETMGSREKAIEATVQKAWEFSDKNDLDNAMKRFNQVLLLDPNNAEAYFGFGVISGKKGQIDEAIKYLQKALELAPDNAEIAYNLGFAYSQKAYQPKISQTEKIDALKNATKYFEYATQKNSKVAYYFGEWANVLYELGEYQEASRILEMAEKIDTKGSQKLRQKINEKMNQR